MNGVSSWYLYIFVAITNLKSSEVWKGLGLGMGKAREKKKDSGRILCNHILN